MFLATILVITWLTLFIYREPYLDCVEITKQRSSAAGKSGQP